MTLPFQLAQAAPPTPQTPTGANPISPEMQALLEQLRDIHEPAAIGWWPLAPGWWILAGVIATLLIGGVWLLLRWREKKRRNLYRTEGRRLLQAVTLDTPRAVEEINILLKRVAVVTFGRDTCAPLTGEAWIDFLESSVNFAMSRPARQVLLESLYSDQSPEPANFEQLKLFAIDWVHHHRLEETPASDTEQVTFKKRFQKAEAEHV